MKPTQDPVLKVAALCGSLRKASFNRGLIRAATRICSESIPDMEIEYVEIDRLPMFNVDLEVDGSYPPTVEAFRQRIMRADCILFASPENNYATSAPMKNALDWGPSPSNVWADKAAAVMSAGGKGTHAQYHIRQIGVFLDIHFINKPEFFLRAYEPPAKFNEHGDLIDSHALEKLKRVLLSLQAFTLRLKAQTHVTASDVGYCIIPSLEDNQTLCNRTINLVRCAKAIQKLS